MPPLPPPLPPHLCTRHCCVVSESTNDSSNELLVVQKLLLYLTDELTINVQYTIENISLVLFLTFFSAATSGKRLRSENMSSYSPSLVKATGREQETIMIYACPHSLYIVPCCLLIDS